MNFGPSPVSSPVQNSTGRKGIRCQQLFLFPGMSQLVFIVVLCSMSCSIYPCDNQWDYIFKSLSDVVGPLLYLLEEINGLSVGWDGE